MPSKIDVLKVKLRAIRSTLDKVPHDKKQGPAGLDVARNFNTILKEVSSAFPDIAADLPKPLAERGAFDVMGKVDASYLDIEILSEQVLGLLDLADD